jgi:oligopeptide transport system substrate-binding protein
MYLGKPLQPIRLVAVLGAALIGVLACGPGGGGTTTNLAKDQVLRYNIGVEPNSFDPGQQQYTYEAAVGRQAFEALLKPNKDLTDVEPATAEKYEVSSDGLTYTFHIRKNAKWSDGQPVKAQDFVYGWQRLIDPRLGAPYNDYYVFKGVEAASKLKATDPADKIDAALQALGLKATDDSTFVVTLSEPAPYFKWIATLWNGAPIRKDVVQKGGSLTDPKNTWATKPETLIGNGPFKVTEIASKDHVTLEASSNYWGGAPTLKKMVFYEISDANADFAKYKNGEVDMNNVPLANTDLVRNDPQLSKELRETPQLGVRWIQFNNTKPPFDNQDVRMAFAKAVDRDKLAKDVFKGRALPISTFIPKGQSGNNPTVGGDPQKFDAAAAKDLLKKAGVTSLNVTYLVRNDTANQQIAQFIQDQIQTNLPGVKITLEVIDSKTVTSRLRQKNFQMYHGGWIGDYPDPQNWFDLFKTGSGNQFSGYSNKQYDDLVKRADVEKDPAKRKDLYDQAHAIIVKEVAGAFMYQGKNFYLVKPYVQNDTITPIDEWPGCYFSKNITIGQH